MSYQDSLSPWVVYRRLPNLQRQQIERFRRRSHAEEFLRLVQRMQPNNEFEIVYDVGPIEHGGDRLEHLLNCFNLRSR